jgi:hypothetical protein
MTPSYQFLILPSYSPNHLRHCYSKIYFNYGNVNTETERNIVPAGREYDIGQHYMTYCLIVQQIELFIFLCIELWNARPLVSLESITRKT